jgi:hypothetical protein
MNMMRKDQVKRLERNNKMVQAKFVASLFQPYERSESTASLATSCG